MQKLLIVSSTEKSVNDFVHVLSVSGALTLSTVNDCASAEKALASEEYDIVLINSPLSDGAGDALAKQAARSGGTQVIMILSPQVVKAAGATLEKHGVFVISRPVSANMFWTVIRLATAARNKMKMLSLDNMQLRADIEDIKVVDRAKCCLIQSLSMTENEAHKYIEKQAMDSRKSKRDIAETILKTYEK